MLEITACDANRYQLAQAEAIAYLDWVKKFAKAYLGEKGDNDEPSSL
ncbi:MAG: type III-B CRISPR module-associated protein Cmr5 [Ghiorsea sp.]|nr:type III-B CRISPR module-associated protein Cmr5 [Ghiorsea sp.]